MKQIHLLQFTERDYACVPREKVIMNNITNPVSPELVDAISDAFNSNDIDKVMYFFADDAVFDQAAGPDIHGTSSVGADAIRAVFGDMFERVESVKWETLDTRIEGDKAICQYRRTATFPSGEIQDFKTVDILTFRDDKIIHKDTYFKQVT